MPTVVDNIDTNTDTTESSVQNASDSAPVDDVSVEAISKQEEKATVSDEEKKPRKRVLGIDLGSTKLVASVTHVSDDGLEPRLPHIVSTRHGSESMPARVAFVDNERLIGDRAMSVSHGASLVFDLLFHESVQHAVQYLGEQVSLSSEQIVAMLIAQFARDVQCSPQRISNDTADGRDERVPLVLAVPDLVDETGRRMVEDACAIAGNVRLLKVFGAALCAARFYASTRAVGDDVVDTTVLIVDIGHLYATIGVHRVTSDGTVTEVAVKSAALGGVRVTKALFDAVVAAWKTKYSVDVTDSKKAVSRLLAACDKAKRVLSTISQTKIQLEVLGVFGSLSLTSSLLVVVRSSNPLLQCLMNDRDFEMDVSRAFLESSCGTYADELGALLDSVVERCGGVEAIDTVELIGGGVRVPFVRDGVLGTRLKRDLVMSGHTLDPHTAVAQGLVLEAMRMLDDVTIVGETCDNVSAPAVPETASEALGLAAQTDTEARRAAEHFFVRTDELVARVGAARDTVERVVLLWRERLSDKAYEAALDDEKRAALRALLDDEEHWLFERDDSGQESDEMVRMYEQRVETLRARIGDVSAELLAVEERQEAEKKKLAEEMAAASARLAAEAASGDGYTDPNKPRTKKQRIELAEKRKQQGNVLLKEFDYAAAGLKYKEGLQFIDPSMVFDMSDEQKVLVNQLRLSLHLNLALAFLKLEMWKKAIEECTSALQHDGKNVKALFRRATAHVEAKDIDAARDDLKAALKVDGDNKECKRLLAKVERLLAKRLAAEKKAYSKMFA